jgi:hypothetical protein
MIRVPNIRAKLEVPNAVLVEDPVGSIRVEAIATRHVPIGFRGRRYDSAVSRAR